MRTPYLIALAAAGLLLCAPGVHARQAGTPPAPAAAPSAAPERCPCCGQPLKPGQSAAAHAAQDAQRAAQPPAAASSAVGGPGPAGTPPGVQQQQGLTIAGKTIPLSWLAAAAGVIVLAAAVYFLVISPWRKRRPLSDAYAIIAQDLTDQFPQAEEKLSGALTAGLRQKDIADARFALSYVRARLGHDAEASTVAEELRKSGHASQESLYLELWLAARQKRDDLVEVLHNEHGDTLGSLLDTRLIVGLSYLRLAKLRWARREIDGALHYYERLRHLGVLEDQIPKHIDDHRIVFGLMKLFDKDHETARKHFEGAVETAKAQGKPTFPAELGLVLCTWSATSDADIDAALGTLIEQMTRARTTAQAPPPSAEPDDDDRPLDDLALLLRNAGCWHAFSLLKSWLRQPARSGLPAGGRDELGRRLAAVRALDPDMADPDLIEGLTDYYFNADDGGARQDALRRIEQAVSHAVNVPEVALLLDREQKLAAQQREGLKRYLSIVKAWVRNPGVPAELRQALRDKLQQHQRFRTLGELDIIEGDPDLAPSVADIRARALVLHRRVSQLVRPRLAEHDEADATGFDSLMKQLSVATEEMGKQAQAVEQTEQQLMITTGEFLIKDEPEDADEPPDGDDQPVLISRVEPMEP